MMTTTNVSTHNNNNMNEQLLLSPFDIDVNDQLFDSPMFTNHSNNNHNSNSNNLQLLSPLLLSPHHGEGFDGLFNDIIHNNNHSYYHHQDPYHHKDGAANVNAVMAANHPTPTDTTVYDQNDFLSQYLTSSSSSGQDSMNRWHNSDPPPLPQLMDSPTTTQPQAAAPIRPSLMRLEVNTQFDETQKAKRVITSTHNTTSTTTSNNNNNTQKNNTKKTTTSVVAVQEEEDNETEEGMEAGARGWQTVFVDPKYANSISIELSSKTRCEEPCSEVPSKMYSSLKYEIRHHATGELCDQVAFLLARISVVDSVNFEEIKKDNRPVLKGVVESALTKPPGDTRSQQKLYGVLKCQFTDVSYHHKKRDFCWQIGLFRPDDLESPIMILRSAPYKVFARKPATNKKRKRETTTTMNAENDSSFTSTSAASSSTSSNNANGWDQFQNRLDDLFRDAKRMKVDDKRKVVGMLCEKMMALDGALFSQTVMNLQQQFSVVEEAQD